MIRSVTLLFAAAILVIVAGCGAGEVDYHGHDIAPLMPELAYTLTDENGEQISAGEYAGKLRLLFFGFTSCPDICPVTLGRLKGALSALTREQRDKVRVLFVSVDPERDTPTKLREYTRYFGPEVIGLTGTQKQLTALTKRYRVTYGYGEPNDNGFYDVSHSSGVFVFGPDGTPRLLWNQSVTGDQMAADLKTLLGQLADADAD